VTRELLSAAEYVATRRDGREINAALVIAPLRTMRSPDSAHAGCVRSLMRGRRHSRDVPAYGDDL
jgi:hypothetical protein